MTFDDFVNEHMDAAIVVHKGKIVYENYPRMDEDQKHIWWSISKAVVGTLIAMLEDEGKVDLEQPIKTYIPEYADSDWGDIKLKHVVEMQAGMLGLEADDPNAYLDMDSPYALYENSLGYAGEIDKGVGSTWDYVKTLTSHREAGTKHEYTGVATFVAQAVVEKIEGKPFNEIMQERIWKHIGAEQEANVIDFKHGAQPGSGGISSTLRDIARYGMQYTPSWNVVSDTQIVSDNVINNIQTTGTNEESVAALEAGMTYGYFNQYVFGGIESVSYQMDGVMVNGDFFKAGYHGQTLYVSPDNDLVVVTFATGHGYDGFTYAAGFSNAMDAAKAK
nr:serine hydrolase domain-containing protein [Agarivorans sp. B2Z047]